MGVRMPRTAGEFQKDHKMPPRRRLGLRHPVRGLQQLREVVKVYGDREMFLPQGLLIDFKRPPYQRLGLCQPIRASQQLCEIALATIVISTASVSDLFRPLAFVGQSRILVKSGSWPG